MGMDSLRATLYISNSIWTREENKIFESALAIYDKETPDRWIRVAEMIPGKSASDVYKQYSELEEDVSCIEAGRVPVPGYNTPSFTLDWVDNRGFDKHKNGAAIVRSSDQERKKGVLWTEDEHRRFLLGLREHGKGYWKDISRNFVVSKTPTQVASHAQKYYNRQNSGVKEKRRPSIHDITTTNLEERLSSDSSNKPPSQGRSNHMLKQQQSFNSSTNVVLDWKDHKMAANMVFNGAHVPSPYEIAINGVKLHGQNLYASDHYGPYKSNFIRY